MEADRAADAILVYDRSAAVLGPVYDSVTFETVHPRLLPHLPDPPARILDVGAGTGRDALALLRRGHAVVAVEPAAALRALGRAAAPDARWLDDRLPALKRVRRLGERFDLILCSAVVMSLPGAALECGLAVMRGLLASGGRLWLTVRDPRDGEDWLHRHSAEAILAAGQAAGLSLVVRGEAADALGRGLLWRSYLFESQGGSRAQPEVG